MVRSVANLAGVANLTNGTLLLREDAVVRFAAERARQLQTVLAASADLDGALRAGLLRTWLAPHADLGARELRTNGTVRLLGSFSSALTSCRSVATPPPAWPHSLLLALTVVLVRLLS